MNDRLLRNYSFLSENLTNLTSVLNLLIENRIISQDEADEIQLETKTKLRQRTELWQTLLKRDWNEIESCLIEILQTTENNRCADVFTGKNTQTPANLKVSILPSKCWPDRKVPTNSLYERKVDGVLLIEKVHEVLNTTDPGKGIIPHKVVICGIGGLGKTTTAKWFSNRYEDEYDHILWLDCSDQNLSKDLIYLPNELGITNLMSDDNKYLAKKCFDKLSMRKCLIIFDDALRFLGEYGIESVLPPENVNFHTIITSRYNEWGRTTGRGRIYPLSIDVFEPSESLQFLREHMDTDESLEKRDLEELSNYLGHLPLALQIAITVSKQTQVTVKQYMTMISTEQPEKLLNYELDDYKYSIQDTMTFSVEEIKKIKIDGELAHEILTVAAYLDPDDIPAKLLSAILKSEDSRIAFALNTLKTHSLVKNIENAGIPTNTMHRLVQQVMRKYNGKSSIATIKKILNIDGFLAYKRVPFLYLTNLNCKEAVEMLGEYEILGLYLAQKKNKKKLQAKRIDCATNEFIWLIQSNIIAVFQEYSLETTLTVDGILESLMNRLGKHNSILKPDDYRQTIAGALDVIYMYSLKMENAFCKSFCFSTEDFEEEHERSFSTAVNDIKTVTFLKSILETRLKKTKDLFETFNLTLGEASKDIVRYMEEMTNLSTDNRHTLENEYFRIKRVICDASKNSCLRKKEEWSKFWLEYFYKHLMAQYGQMKEENDRNRKMEWQETVKDAKTQLVDEFALKKEKWKQQLEAQIEKMKKDLQMKIETEWKKAEGQLVLKLENQFAELQERNDKKYNAKLLEIENGRELELRLRKGNCGPVLANVSNSSGIAIGIHLGWCNNVYVSVFSNSNAIMLINRKNVTFGYNDKVFISESPDSDLPIKLSALLTMEIGTPVETKWEWAEIIYMEELLAILLSELKMESEMMLGGTVNICAVSIPSRVHPTNVQAVYDACRIAGFQHIEVFWKISAAAASTLMTSASTIPKEFIAVETTSKGYWAVGYYNLNHTLKLSSFSKGYFHKTGSSGEIMLESILNSISPKMKMTLPDIVNVVIFGEKSVFLKLFECTSQKLKVYQLDETCTSNGNALIAALMANDKSALDLWQKYMSTDNGGKATAWQDYLSFDLSTTSYDESHFVGTPGTNLTEGQVEGIQSQLKILGYL